MKHLAYRMKKGGFDYEQIIRSKNIALYAQYSGGTKIAHELFIIPKREKTMDIYGKDYAPSELMPSNEMFGTSAWSITKDQLQALSSFRKLVEQKNDPVYIPNIQPGGSGRL